MSKRILFILFSALALILSISCKTDDLTRAKIQLTGPFIAASHQIDVAYSLNVTKDNKREIKKPIRIKAWDAKPLNLPAAWVINTTDRLWFTKPFYQNYSSSTLQRHCLYCSLRGPPIA